MIEEDNGAKAIDIVKRAEAGDPDSETALCGLAISKRPEKEELVKLRMRARESLIRRQQTKSATSYEHKAKSAHGDAHGGGHH